MLDHPISDSSDSELGFIFNGLNDNNHFHVYVQNLGSAGFFWNPISSPNGPLSNFHGYTAVNGGSTIICFQDATQLAGLSKPTIGNSWLTIGFNSVNDGPDPNWTMTATDVSVTCN